METVYLVTCGKFVGTFPTLEKAIVAVTEFAATSGRPCTIEKVRRPKD